MTDAMPPNFGAVVLAMPPDVGGKKSAKLLYSRINDIAVC